MPLRPPAGFIRPGFDPLKVPNAPTIGTATGGDTSASVAFTAPSNVGGSAISAYYAVSNPSQITGTGASSPVSVTGLTNGTPYTFTVWALNTYGPSPYSAASNSVTPQATRGVFFGGTASGTYVNVIQYVSISSTGNATDFGDLLTATAFGAGCSSSTRGLFGGGAKLPSFVATNTIQYITIMTTGNATDFGDLTQAKETRNSACSSSTRGVWGGGYDSGLSNVIDYVTIASTGNATDFGDLTVATYSSGSCASPVRGLFAGGGGPDTNVIGYITIASAGNAIDFGDLTSKRQGTGGCSSSTRGLFGGGYGSALSPTVTNFIDYVTIATTGNATDFGDLTVARYTDAACSSTTRGVFAGGYTGSGDSNVIDYVTIGTTGNALDFGDLLAANQGPAACSNGHGGL